MLLHSMIHWPPTELLPYLAFQEPSWVMCTIFSTAREKRERAHFASIFCCTFTVSTTETPRLWAKIYLLWESMCI